jgi:hypothetical protein
MAEVDSTWIEYLDTTRLEEIVGSRWMAAALEIEQCPSRMVPGSRDRRWIQVGGVIGHDESESQSETAGLITSTGTLGEKLSKV